MNREFSDGSLFSVAGISHKSKNVSGRNSITDCEIRLIRGKVRIIKKGTGFRTDSNSVTAQRKPAFLFDDAIGDADDWIIVRNVVRGKNIGTFVPALSSVAAWCQPAVFKKDCRIGNWEIFQI